MSQPVVVAELTSATDQFRAELARYEAAEAQSIADRQRADDSAAASAEQRAVVLERARALDALIERMQDRSGAAAGDSETSRAENVQPETD